MNEIRVLDKSSIDKIAAGEVVERPASAVKELVENSIDAGAKSISVEIEDGGVKLIRVTDNGSGIPKDQVKIAVLPHATSKIRSADDLRFVTSLGFRGEALSSIGAVTDLEICTKTEQELTGTIYKISGGNEVSISEAGLPTGTTMIIRNFFSYVPARLKFLKSSTWEANQVYDVLEKIALANPEIAVKFISNGKIRLNTSGSGSLKDVIYSIYGKETVSNLIEIDGTSGFVHVSGFIGKPEISRGNRNYELYFVNGRYVKSKTINEAIEESYKGLQMKGTFPFTILNIELEPELMDVNVHPSKLEIRFDDPIEIYENILDIIGSKLKERENIPEVRHLGEKITLFKPSNDTVQSNKQNTVEPFERNRSAAFRESTTYRSPYTGGVGSRSSYTSTRSNREENIYSDSIDDLIFSSINSDSSENVASETATEYTSESSSPEVSDNSTFEQQTLFSDKFLSEKARVKHRVIGEVFDTYWLVQYDNELFIIDQHAAHEKVLYEEFMEKLNNAHHESQLISPGIVVTLSPKEESAFLKYRQQFEKMGFNIEHFGGNDYIITEVPTDLYSLNDKDLFYSFIDELTENQASVSSEFLLNRVATAACKAAVKGNNRLSLMEADELIRKLMSLENPYNCPHGRPTIIKMSKNELEKKFNRII